jgi:hypothetical protein
MQEKSLISFKDKSNQHRLRRAFALHDGVPCREGDWIGCRSWVVLGCDMDDEVILIRIPRSQGRQINATQVRRDDLH